MGYRKYTDVERRRMTEIYVRMGAHGSIIPAALDRIKNELGIVLPKDGRSLRLWQDHYQMYPVVKTAELDLFPMVKEKPVVKKTLLPFEEFQRRLQVFAGSDNDNDRNLLDEIYNELKSGRMRESLKTMPVQELVALKRMIEEGQQKRELHLIKMTEFVDYRKKDDGPDRDEIDNLIIKEMEEAEANGERKRIRQAV